MMLSTQPQRPSSYSVLQQVVAGALILSTWGCATTPAPPKPGQPVPTTRKETAVVGRLVVVESGVDQTPYASTADQALCFVPDGVTPERTEKGVRAATFDADGTFRVLLPPGNYKLYAQYRISQSQWLAILPMAKLTVSRRHAAEVEYAGTLRVEIEPATQAHPSKSWTAEVRQVPITLTDDSQQQSLGPDTRLIPALLHLESNVALVQPQHALQACSARGLFAQPAKTQGADVAKGVLAALLLIPLLAIVVVLGVVSGGGGGSLKFPNM